MPLDNGPGLVYSSDAFAHRMRYIHSNNEWTGHYCPTARNVSMHQLKNVTMNQRTNVFPAHQLTKVPRNKRTNVFPTWQPSRKLTFFCLLQREWVPHCSKSRHTTTVQRTNISQCWFVIIFPKIKEFVYCPTWKSTGSSIQLFSQIRYLKLELLGGPLSIPSDLSWTCKG